jgi:hypothetical protein
MREPNTRYDTPSGRRLLREAATILGAVRETAEDAYWRNRKEVDRLLAEIERRIKRFDQSFKKNSTNWGYVGDVAHVVEVLRDLSLSLAGEAASESTFMGKTAKFRGRPLTFNEAYNVLKHQFLRELSEELAERLGGAWQVVVRPINVSLVNRETKRFIQMEFKHSLPFMVQVNLGGPRFDVAVGDVAWTADKIMARIELS